MTVSATETGGTRDGDRRRGPGRPRDHDIDEQVLSATLELIDADEPVTVSRVVERSGVSRAALYRRWPSLTVLVAAALDVDHPQVAPIPTDGDLRDTLRQFVTESLPGVEPARPFEVRFRQRIRLAMTDRALQKAYWESHVSRRRTFLENALRAGVDAGILRADLDVEAAFDLIAGVAYYQVVVRGDWLDDPAVQERCRAAFETVWRGMLAPPASSP